MQALTLAHPAIQSGIVPFAVSILILFLARPLGPARWGLAVVAGFLVTAVLAMGVQLTPLTSTRRLLILVLASLPVGLLAGTLGRSRAATGLLAGLGVAAVLWLLYPILIRRELLDVVLLGGGCSIFVGWLVVAMDTLLGRAGAVAGGGTVLGFATGISVLLGASALLGQLGLALGAAAAAPALAILLGHSIQSTRAATFPVALAAGLVGCAGLVFAKLPWFSLPCLAAVPLLAAVPRPGAIPKRLDVVWSGVLGLVPAAAAVLLTWWVAGGVPM